MSRWVYIGMAYGLAWSVLAAYLTYLSSALCKNRRHLEELSAKPSEKRRLVEDRA